MKDKASKVKVVNQGPVSFVFFVAWVGALVYFVGQVDGFWNIILAFLKACVWPAIVMHRVLEILNIQ
jgi:hypothetical protein